MQKKGLRIFTDAGKRRAVLHGAVIVFLALLIVRLFACTTFFQVPDFISSCITFGLAGYMGLMLLLVLPELDSLLLGLWIALLVVLGGVFLIHRSGLEYIFLNSFFCSKSTKSNNLNDKTNQRTYRSYLRHQT